MGIYTDKAGVCAEKSAAFFCKNASILYGTEHILMGLLDEPDSSGRAGSCRSRSDTEGTAGDDRSADSPGMNGS